MSAAAALGLPPGVRFDPTPEELVEFYLMPRALGQPTAVPGIIIDDADAEATTSSSRHHPWKLLARNRRTDDDEAYFFERIATSGGDAAARQDRSCGGGRWTWVGQKRAPDEVLRLNGEQVWWGKYSLNLQEGRRKGGSTGWVMHEYTIASPPMCPPCPVKLCHVAFTGHGQKRQRVPDDDDDELEAGTPQHKRVATASSVVTTATATTTQQNQEQPFPNYGTSSSVANFWGGSDAGGSSQESSIRFCQESSITVLDPWYPDAGTSHQEPFLLDQDQKLAQNQAYFSNQPQAFDHQEQFVNQGAPSAEAFCAMLLASGHGSSSNPDQEPPLGQPLSKEEQLRLQLDQFFGGISTPRCPPIEPVTVTADAAYHEEQIQTTAPEATADLPLGMDQKSCTTEQSHGDMDDLHDFFDGWSDLDTFTDTSGVLDYGHGSMAAGTLAGDGPGDGTCYDGRNRNFAVTA